MAQTETPPVAAAALDLLSDLVTQAQRAGADEADAVLVDSVALNVGRRLGKPEQLERTESGEIGLRVLVGKRQAMVSSADRSPKALRATVERAVAMARAVPEDPFAGLAAEGEIARAWADLDLNDPAEPDVETLIEDANRAEAAALAVPGITNSEGASASWGRSVMSLVASNGFAGSYAGSNHSLSVSVLAGEGTGMERDYDYTTAAFRAALDAPEAIGRKAGERAIRRLNPKKGETKTLPVVFDPRISGGFLRSLSGAISGAAIARGTSFLKEMLGKKIFSDGVTVWDDPSLKRAMRSRPFDGEGIAAIRRAIVENGELTTWLLDTRSARQLGLRSTGHASRGAASPPSPSPSNLWLAPGTLSPEALIGEIAEGFYVTEMMGMGTNLLTGDYSRGAAGFWIKNGKLDFPVSEMTVAGNLRDMFLRLTPANDLLFKTGIDAPTIRIDGMTVAGT
jgi:PmbA protein